MCLVLKLENGKVVFLENEQSARVTEPSSTVLVYRCSECVCIPRAKTITDTSNVKLLGKLMENHQGYQSENH